MKLKEIIERLKKGECFTSLEFSIDTKTLKKSDAELITYCIKNSTSLKKLSLSIVSITAKTCAIIADVIKENYSLTEVTLYCNGRKQNIYPIIEAMINHPTLLAFDISSGFQKENVLALSKMIKQNITLKSLKLSMGPDTDLNTFYPFLSALKYNKTLTTFQLSHVPIDGKAANYIARFLKATVSLNFLSLHFYSVDNDSIKVIADGLSKNSTLQRFTLECNPLSMTGVNRPPLVALGNSLKKNTILTSLDLSRLSMAEYELRSFADALKVNKSLTELYISLSGSQAILGLAKILQQANSLKILTCATGNIDFFEATLLANAIKENNSLTCLDLKDNLEMTRKSFVLILDALAVNTALTHVYFPTWDPFFDMRDRVERYMLRNQKIKTVIESTYKLNSMLLAYSHSKRAGKSIQSNQKSTDKSSDLQDIEKQSKIAADALNWLKEHFPQHPIVPKIDAAYDEITIKLFLSVFQNFKQALKGYRSLPKEKQRSPNILAFFSEFFFVSDMMPGLKIDKARMILSCLVRYDQTTDAFLIHEPEHHAMKVKSALMTLFFNKGIYPQQTFLSIQKALQEKGLLPKTTLTEEEEKIDPEVRAKQKVLALAKEKGYLIDPVPLLLKAKTTTTTFFKPSAPLENTPSDPSTKEEPLQQDQPPKKGAP